jgi:hypothetical protein
MSSMLTFSNFLIFFVALCLIAMLGFKDNADGVSVIRPRKNKNGGTNDPSVPPENTAA